MMNRLIRLISHELSLQYHYGFILLYLFLSLIYIALIRAVSSDWQPKLTVLLIFSDPAAMGLYFMGSMVLFEKNEGVINQLAVAPITVQEYIVAKVLSVSLIGSAAAVLIGLLSGGLLLNIYQLIGLLMTCLFFSLFGLLIAVNAPSLNRFLLNSVPVELFISLPAMAVLFGYDAAWLSFHPGVLIMRIFLADRWILLWLMFLAGWLLLVYWLVLRSTNRMFKILGGVRL
ncbi:MAG: hypothetical protein VB012_00325 [Erysipelotrichaceae bacterium]|nr:hypothetical protein [Erysipelotrichaceae bacterium]